MTKRTDDDKKTALVLTFVIVYAILEQLLSKGGNVLSSYRARLVDEHNMSTYY